MLAHAIPYMNELESIDGALPSGSGDVTSFHSQKEFFLGKI